ncbi:neurochondrin [Abrus precatorius]|uniref:Neurochondrin n=1 Tax=Abrus precatorius TaxID=3816 RepID=A0A8B8M685_ABRPR|nr:neurochondrin [Abrus precatorius]
MSEKQENQLLPTYKLSTEEEAQNLNLEECLKLLKGERDEQRLAGLLLVTKFCKANDHFSLRRVYDAVGPNFLYRLLRTGMGSGTNDHHDAYLSLSITVLAAFCRVPEIASSEDMVSNIPLILEVMSTQFGSSVLEECYEYLYLVLTASERGIRRFCESGGIRILASQMSSLQDGSHLMEMSFKLWQLILSRVSLNIIQNDDVSDISVIVAAIARQFAVLHNSLKFEALHLLNVILSSKDLSQLHDVIRLLPRDNWSHNIRTGIVAILQNRVAPAERLQALILAESMVSMYGEDWLVSHLSTNDAQNPAPADMCLLLVLEQSRVEIAVLLNELAYLKYEAPQDTSATAEAIFSKRRNVAVAYSLVEKIIKLISTVDGNDGNLLDEGTLTKLILQLNETIVVVLEYLEDAKEHGQKKGDDLLASVRIIGSYLAEAPLACNEKVQDLLGYMLSVEGEDEQRPFYSVCFLLPMLSQITMKIEGCKALALCKGLEAVVDCLNKLVRSNAFMAEDNGCIILACDTITNLLLKKDKVQMVLDESVIVDLLKALTYWSENTNEMSSMMMASSICALVFDYTSEAALLNCPDFNYSTLSSLYRLIARCLTASEQDTKDDMDLSEIISSGFSRWAHRYPHIREAVEN